MPFKELFIGKRVLVTGAGRGLGRALVKRLHGYGANVIALSRTESHLKTLQAELPGLEIVCVDLGDWDKAREIVGKLETVDILVNNAALILVKGVMSTSSEEFDSLINVNLKSVMSTCQLVAEKMIAAGKSGSIVNVSSVGGTKPSAYNGLYCVTKAALEMMTKCLAVELGPKKIRVNTFAPAAIDTDMLQELASSTDNLIQKEGTFKAFMKYRTPTQAVLMPTDECINTLLFLMSDLTTQITGHNLTLDGGFLCT